MTEPTLSTRIRAVQDDLSAINNELTLILDDATHIGLANFRLASIHHAIANNEHAWNALNLVATSLELTGTDHKP